MSRPLPPDVVAALLDGDRPRARDMMVRAFKIGDDEADRCLAAHEKGTVGKVLFDPAVGRVVRHGAPEEAIEALCAASGMDRDEAETIVASLRSRSEIAVMSALGRLGNRIVPPPLEGEEEDTPAKPLAPGEVRGDSGGAAKWVVLVAVAVAIAYFVFRR